MALTLKSPRGHIPRDRHCSIEAEASYRWHSLVALTGMPGVRSVGAGGSHTKRWSSVSIRRSWLTWHLNMPESGRGQNPVHKSAWAYRSSTYSCLSLSGSHLSMLSACTPPPTPHPRVSDLCWEHNLDRPWLLLLLTTYCL